MLGDDAAAEPIISAAVERRPDNPEILLHAAMILAASGKTSVAVQRLDAAVRLDPTLNQRADVQDLRARLASPK